MITIVAVLVVSGALILGALWGIYGRLNKEVEGFIIGLLGGALIVSAVMELIEPAIQQTAIWIVLVFVLIGAVVFAVLDYLVDIKWGASQGSGLLVAIVLDGIPENLALGVALIGTGPLEVAALAGSIFLSNLPEAAGGAKEMSESGQSSPTVLGLWVTTAAVLSLAALAGNFLLAGASEDVLAMIRCFAGGAVVSSLATEVFPKAFKEDSYVAGVAAALGLTAALALNQLGQGG